MAIAVVVAVTKTLIDISQAEMSRFAPAEEPISLDTDPEGFRGRVEFDTWVDGRQCLVFQIRGVIPGAHGDWLGSFEIGAVDLSGDEAVPVRCSVADLRAPVSGAFRFRTEPLMLGEMAWIDGWTTLVRVPVDCFRFPGSGERRVCVFFGVCDSSEADAIRCHDEVEVSVSAPDVDALPSIGDVDLNVMDAGRLARELTAPRATGAAH